jgi:hypothetical protein
MLNVLVQTPLFCTITKVALSGMLTLTPANRLLLLTLLNKMFPDEIDVWYIVNGPVSVPATVACKILVNGISYYLVNEKLFIMGLLVC